MMKTHTLVLTVLFVIGFAFISCNKTKKEVKEEATEQVKAEATEHNHSDDMAMATYQCPMKCEGDKTYDEVGTCPTCKMDLKKVEVSNNDNSENSEEEKHEDH